MNIILLEDIDNLGHLGEVITVKDGYGRNYLIPQGKAKRATKSNIIDFEQKRQEYASKQNDILLQAQERCISLDGKVFEIRAKSGVDGKLFGSITALNIVEAIKNAGIEVQKKEVQMPHGAFKTLGEFEVKIALHRNVQANIKLNIISEAV